MTPTVDDYLNFRETFAVSRELARSALSRAQPFALEALGIHTQRQILMDGELPAYIVMTTPATNGGWSELMPVWFKPYERPVPIHCLDNWALFALLYQSAFGASDPAFTVEALARVVIGADLLLPFLPGTDGAGRFLRHGALPILLAILWLEPPLRDSWLKLHAAGAKRFAETRVINQIENLDQWLEQIENEAWLVPTREPVIGATGVQQFLADERRPTYSALFGGLCLGVSALANTYGTDWRKWVFQAINVGYRLPDFGLAEIQKSITL